MMTMNTLELIILLVTTAGLLAYLRWRFASWKLALLLTLSVLPALYLATERLTQFLIIDGTGYMDEVLTIGPGRKPGIWFQWLGVLRTTDIIFGPLAMVRHKFLRFISIRQLEMLFKGLHWLIGIALFMGVYHVLDRRYVSRQKDRPEFFTLFVMTALLLPTNSLAIKTFAYDIYSLELGILALLMLAAAVEDGKPRTARWAVVAAFFAAQEKMLIAPILLLALAVDGYLAALQAEKQRAVKLVTRILSSTAIILAISFAEAVIISLMRSGRDMTDFLLAFADPLNSWAWPIVALTFGGTLSRNMIPVLSVVSIALAVTGALIFLWLDGRLRAQAAQLGGLVQTINRVLLPLMLVVSVVSLFAITARIDPYAPIPSGNYQPVTRFNFVIEHYNARTMLGHFLAHTGFTYGVYIADIPTVYWLFVGASWLTLVVRKRKSTPSLAVEVLLLGGILLPLAFGLLQMPYPTPPSGRYMNIGLTMLTLAMLVNAVESFADLPRTFRAAYPVIFSALLVTEMLPFAPLYGPFRPIWLNPPNDQPKPGYADPVWWGWGEEYMLAGREMLTRCSLDGEPAQNASDPVLATQPCESLRLHSVFQSRWLGTDLPIKQGIFLFDDHGFEDTDYYLINRTSIIIWGGILYEPVEPVFTLEYRGYTYAWVYRGSELRAAGYDF